jgi:hypothetical protein
VALEALPPSHAGPLSQSPQDPNRSPVDKSRPNEKIEVIFFIVSLFFIVVIIILNFLGTIIQGAKLHIFYI